jgi:hypothetical protein
MTEMTKTSVFAGAGALALLLAFAWGSTDETFDVETLVGSRINEFDVEDPKVLRVVRFTPETGQKREFEVAEKNGVWTIPSKQGYPADAAEHMADAATCLQNREILRIASSDAQDHAEYGVIDPLADNLDSKSEGVGARVTMIDAKDETLVDMIIGKQVKDAEGQYYVRRVNQDVVYVVSLDPEKLTTDFADWIEDDLLGLNAFDVNRLFINDYSAELGMALTPAGLQMQVNWDRRGQYEVAYDNDQAKWQPVSLQEYSGGRGGNGTMVDFTLGPNEELNEDALRELRNALDDLLIVDVEKKPKGLSADLKAGEDFLAKDNEQTVESLIAKGFAPVSLSPGGPPEILSSEGEVICSLNNGVEYVLRFGKLKVSEAEQAAAEAAPGAEGADDATGEKLNRYLFVSTRFNENLVERPALEELPELPPGAESAAEPAATAESNADAANEADVAPAAEPAAVEEEEEEEEEPATPADADAAAASPAEDESAAPAAEEAAQEPAAEQPAAVDAPAAEPAVETPIADASAAEAPAAEAGEDAAASADAAPAADDAAATEPPAAEPETLEQLIARRKSIEQENQRKLDDYERKLKEGR